MPEPMTFEAVHLGRRHRVRAAVPWTSRADRLVHERVFARDVSRREQLAFKLHAGADSTGDLAGRV
jgi:hypothetical protein